MKGGAYLSCYSCPYSMILTNDKQERLVRCALYRKTFQMKPGMSFPDFCEIKAVNNPQK